MIERITYTDSMPVIREKINNIMDYIDSFISFVIDSSTISNLSFVVKGGRIKNGQDVIIVNDTNINLIINSTNFVGIVGGSNPSIISGVIADKPTSNFTLLYEITTNGVGIITITDLRTIYETYEIKNY